MRKKITLFISCLAVVAVSSAQTATPVFYKGAIAANKTQLHRSIVQNTITRNLTLPLKASTEENWMDAFWALELLQFRAPWITAKIAVAFDSVTYRSTAFQRALMELAYANYPGSFTRQVQAFLPMANNAKVFAMACEYLLRNPSERPALLSRAKQKKQFFTNREDAAILHRLMERLQPPPTSNFNFKLLLQPSFLEKRTVLFSFQRKNRDYPGLAIIRDSTGAFVTDAYGNLFAVPQLARSISNLPGYLTNGNTPQGLFRMFGFDTSKTTFIGPTTNIQLTMPFETSLRHFFSDSTITDSLWTIEWYQRLLPEALRKERALWESFYAGMAGRTEIIAHGTTVDPTYYTGAPYFPQTPTMGCLCTKETWSEEDGRRLESDQLKLTEALQRAGGADGYCVVIEIDDDARPVAIEDLLELINNSKL